MTILEFIKILSYLECKAFKEAKEKLVSAPILAHYDPSKKLKLAADASQYGIGAVLSHVFVNGCEKPIAYASRTLSKAEQQYAQIDKEALGLIFGVRRFHQYLYDRTFVLITDHKPLLYPSSDQRMQFCL